MPRDHRRADVAHNYWSHSDPTPTEPPSNPGTACPGRCNTAWRAAENRLAESGTPHTLAARPGFPIWCPPCNTSIRGALGDMPELAVRLHLEVESGISATNDERVSGSRERALHQHQGAAFALEDIAGVLEDWEDAVRDQRNLAPRSTATAGQPKTVELAVRFLGRHLAWLLADHPDREASEEFGLEVLALHRKAQAMTRTGDVRPERCHGVSCPNCDLFALEWEVDKDTGVATGDVRCRVCKPEFVMTRDEYDRWVRMLGHEARHQRSAHRRALADVGRGR